LGRHCTVFIGIRLSGRSGSNSNHDNLNLFILSLIFHELEGQTKSSQTAFESVQAIIHVHIECLFLILQKRLNVQIVVILKMISHAGPVFIFPNRLAKSVAFLADVFLFQGAVKRLMWWQSWLAGNFRTARMASKISAAPPRRI